jgi:hypothetical protein
MPSPFVTENSRLPFPKSDRVPLPAGLDANQHLTASEWNQTCQAVIDMRAWFISASYYGYVSQSSMPNVQMGLSGTVGATWLSSSLHPYLSTTSSAGLNTRKIVLAPTGTNQWTGYWNNVLVDEQGIIVSGSYEASAGGGSSSTASLDFLTRNLTVQNNAYMSGTVLVTSLTASSGIKSLLDMEAVRNLVVGGNVTMVSATGTGGIKALDLEVTRNSIFAAASFVSLTSSMGVKAVDLEVTRNAIFAAASFVSLTSSMGVKAVDLEITRNASFVNLTSSAGMKTLTDFEAVRDIIAGRNIRADSSITGTVDLKIRNINASLVTVVGNIVCENLQQTQDELTATAIVCDSVTATDKFVGGGITGSYDVKINRHLNIGGYITGSDSGWIAPGLTNSWVNFGSGFAEAGYRKDALGYVHLKGTIKNGTIDAAAFTLPNGYKPGSKLVFPNTSNGNIGTDGSTIYVDTDGTIKPQVPSANVAVSLDCIHFFAEG